MTPGLGGDGIGIDVMYDLIDALKQNPSWAPAFFGLVGSLVGASAAFVGVLVSQFWEHRRKREEREAARIDKLKDAYVEWFAALQFAMSRSHRLEHASSQEERIRVGEELQTDSALSGQKLELLETDASALSKVEATVADFFDALNRGLRPEATPEARKKDRADFANRATEVSQWLRDERFAVGYKVVPLKAKRS